MLLDPISIENHRHQVPLVSFRHNCVHLSCVLFIIIIINYERQRLPTEA